MSSGHDNVSWQTAYTLAGNRRRKGTQAGRAPVPEETRMGAVDIGVLILKLMVAVLQLLDAVLNQLR